MTYQTSWNEFAFQDSLNNGYPFIAFPNNTNSALVNTKPAPGECSILLPCVR